MRSHASAALLRFGTGLLAGCVLASLAGCTEPSASAAASGLETSTSLSIREPGSGPPRAFIREVRLGCALDPLGKVPPGSGASRFAVGDPIHLSLWQVTDARGGSVVGVSVWDATDRIVWSEDKQAPQGGSYVSFDIGRALVRGEYRADVIIDREVRSRMGFKVFEWK